MNNLIYLISLLALLTESEGYFPMFPEIKRCCNIIKRELALRLFVFKYNMRVTIANCMEKYHE